MKWETKTLGEIYDLEGGKVQTGPFGSQLHESDYTEFGVPVIMPKDIKNDQLDFSSIARISEDDANRLSQHIVEINDVIFPRRGEINKRALITEDTAGAFCGTGCIRLRGTGTILNPEYLFYYLKQKNIVGWIENQAIGATMMNLNTSILRSIPIHYPEKVTEQRELAFILSAYDDLIENNNKRIKLLEEMAEEIYKEWFVRMRFPGYQDCKFFDKEGNVVPYGTEGALPEGWELKDLNDIVDIISGFAFKSESFEETGKYRLVTIKNVQNGFFVTDTTDCIHELPKKLKEDIFIKDKDILLSLTGNIGRICLAYGDNYLLNQRVAKLKPRSNELFEFVYMFFRSEILRRTLENLSNGAAQQNLSPIDMGKLKFGIPNQLLLEKYSGITSPFFEEIIALNKKNQALQETRDLLLPRLISGKLDVSGLDIDETENLSMAAEPEANY
ncbi:restriction endonuclease subunit S [Ekhidna sp. To15]|uniref:restriction endonuclease subunit S n=1 Tax=Ekhidna sp. To15 TaxID=3395267 RepID=UPI003F51B43A